jgi:hypothetical protein
MADEVWGGYRGAVLANNEPTPSAEAVEVVVLELEAFPLAVQVYEAEQKAGTVKPGANKQLRLAAKTILGSVDNLFRLPDFSKGVIAVLGEALDLLGSN